jgi:hypothetical protein
VTNSGNKLGPRTCLVCGPSIEGCWQCRSKTGHRHVVVVNRAGEEVGSVAACDAHSPNEVTRAVRVTRSSSASTVRDPKKRERDRQRRLAQRIVLDRYADEVTQELEEIRRREG